MTETSIKYSQNSQYYTNYSVKGVAKPTEQSMQSSTEYLEQNKTQGEFSDLIKQKKEEILERIKNGEEETTFQIGGTSMTQSEWKRLIGKVDNAIEQIKEEQEIEEQEIKEQEIEEQEIKEHEIEEKQEAKKDLETQGKQEVENKQEVREEKEELEEEKDITESMIQELLKDRGDSKEKL